MPHFVYIYIFLANCFNAFYSPTSLSVLIIKQFIEKTLSYQFALNNLYNHTIVPSMRLRLNTERQDL